MRTLLLGTAIAVSAVGLAGCGSSETSPDDQYISELNAIDNPFVSDERAIDFGKTVCTQLEDGETVATLSLGMTRKLATTTEQTATIIGGAIRAYCPEHKGQFMNLN